MRHLELHVIETEHDIDLALQAGLLSLDRLDSTKCADCGEEIGYAGESFQPFVVTIDENDDDWSICEECASPVIYGGVQDPSDSVEWLALREEEEDDDLEHF